MIARGIAGKRCWYNHLTMARDPSALDLGTASPHNTGQIPSLRQYPTEAKRLPSWFDKETYRNQVSASFEVLEAIIAPLLRLWWTIVVRKRFSTYEFRISGKIPFCHSTPPYRGSAMM